MALVLAGAAAGGESLVMSPCPGRRGGQSRARRLPALTAVPCRGARPAEAAGGLGAEGRQPEGLWERGPVTGVAFQV